MKHLFVILAAVMSLLFPQTAMSDPLPDNIVGAQFPGGTEQLIKFLSENIKYPVECEASGITGRVVVGFVVEKDGKVTQVKLDRSSDPAFNMEAYKVMKKMPRWIPGKVGDEPITVKYKLPITFRL